jgi:hypothetical protein
MKQQEPSSFSAAETLWMAQFKDVCGRTGHCFSRSETRNRARAYPASGCSALWNAKMAGSWQKKRERENHTRSNIFWIERYVMQKRCAMCCVSISLK